MVRLVDGVDVPANTYCLVERSVHAKTRADSTGSWGHPLLIFVRILCPESSRIVTSRGGAHAAGTTTPRKLSINFPTGTDTPKNYFFSGKIPTRDKVAISPLRKYNRHTFRDVLHSGQSKSFLIFQEFPGTLLNRY